MDQQAADRVARQLLEQFFDSAVLLLALPVLAADGEISFDQLEEIASSPALAHAATHEGCEWLANMLLEAAAHLSSEESLLLGCLAARHAGALNDLGKHREAMQLYETITPTMRDHAPPEMKAKCEIHRANALAGQGRYEEALVGYDAALRFLEQHGLPVDVGGCQMNRAIALADQSRYAEAVTGYDAALRLLQPHGLPLDVADCHMNRAIALAEQGRYAEALAGYDAALPLIRQHGLPVDLALCQLNRASALQKHGRHAEALTLYDEALPLYQQHGPSADVARFHMNRASVLASQGRYAEAVAAYDAALPLLERYGLPLDVARCQMNRASALDEQARYAEALAEYDAAIAVLEQHGMLADAAACHMNRANTLQSLKRYPEAVAAYDAALRLLEQHGLPVNVANCHMNRANALAWQGRYEEVVAGYDTALPLFQQYGRPADVALCQMNRANALAWQGKHADAVLGYERIDPRDLSGNTLRSFHGQFASSLWSMDQRECAVAEFAMARQAMRRARRTARVDEHTLEFVAEQRGVVRRSVECALEEGQTAEAFAAVQDGKGGVLGDLRQRRDEITGEEPPDVFTARRQLTEWLRRPPQGVSRDEWEAERLRQAAPYFTAWGRFHHAYRADFSDSGNDDAPTSLAEIQAALPDDWAILDFWQTASDAVAVFVITRDGLAVERLEFPVKEHTIVWFLDGLQRLDDEDPKNVEILDQLEEYLFVPLRRRLRDRGIRGLYLVPHGILHLLPLHASRRMDKGQAVYLGDEFAVAYLPSAAMLPSLPRFDTAQLRRRMSEASGRGDAILSLANPERGPKLSLPRSLSDNQPKLSLPLAEWEGRMLARRLGQDSGRFHAGPDATLDRTTTWPAGGLMHFSCHGFGDTSMAPLSHLRLADDLLLAHDVAYRRPTLPDGSLVILNGCQTSVSDWRAVDEGMGLTSAFLSRGAGLVLSTSWSVTDGCAAQMVLKFVAELLDRGTAPTDALREAQSLARNLSAEEILAWCDDVRQEFPSSDYPAEAMKLHAQAAFVSKRAGLEAAARHHGDEAARLLRRLDLGNDADRILALTRSAATTDRPSLKRSFDCPTFWAAFQLVGRVT